MPGDDPRYAFVERIDRVGTVVVDEIACFDGGRRSGRGALYRLVDAAYERRSLILASNLRVDSAKARRRRPLAIRTQPATRKALSAHVISEG